MDDAAIIGRTVRFEVELHYYNEDGSVMMLTEREANVWTLTCRRPSDQVYEQRPADWDQLIAWCRQYWAQQMRAGYKRMFEDEEGDRVQLDRVDSYAEAFKVAKKLGRLVAHAIRPATPWPKMTSETIRKTMVATTPAWFRREMEKMKADLKKEIMTEMSQAGSSGRRRVAEDENVVVKKRGRKDYIARAWAEGAVNAGLVVDQSLLVVGAEQQALVEEGPRCDLCHGPLGEPYFVCVEWECRASLCRACEPGHPADHPLLRLPRVMREGRRRAADLAHSALLNVSTPKHDRKAGKKKADQHQHQQQKACKKAAKSGAAGAADRKWSADVVTEEVAQVEPAGLVTVTWLVTNTGKRQWNDKVKLVYISSSDPALEPVEWSPDVPALKPGRGARIQVRLRAPITPGQFSTFWKVCRKGKDWIASLNANVTVKGPTTAPDHSYAAAAAVVDDLLDHDQRSETSRSADLERDYDVINQVDDTDDQEATYESVVAMVEDDSSLDSTGNLADVWRRLSIVDRPCLVVEHEQLIQLDQSTTTLEAPAGVDEEHGYSSDIYAANLCHREGTVASNTASAIPNIINAPDAPTEVDEEHGYSSEGTGSLHSMYAAKLNQLKDTVTSNTASALLSTTQTLAQVGATARAMVSRAGTSTGGQRAWVPKGTQTEHNDVVDLYHEQLAQLVHMGFTDMASNIRALRRADGDLEWALTVLIDQQ